MQYPEGIPMLGQIIPNLLPKVAQSICIVFWVFIRQILYPRNRAFPIFSLNPVYIGSHQFTDPKLHGGLV